jgi:hypothetical protein
MRDQYDRVERRDAQVALELSPPVVSRLDALLEEMWEREPSVLACNSEGGS